MASKEGRTAVVVGAGAIGACTAYFLAKKGFQVTLVEQTAVACAASGKAGGFLALDWSDSSPLQQLARASFSLHRQLAQELDGPSSYGYRTVHTLSVLVHETSSPTSTSRPSRSSATASTSLPSWINGSGVRSSSIIGSPTTTAQVHPLLFTHKIVSTAVENYNARIVIGKLGEVVIDKGSSRVSAVVVDGTPISADAVVLAMGPWSARNEIIKALTSVSGLKAHSIVLRPTDPDAISPHALFLKYKSCEGRVMDPEVYPRPTGEVYVCGMSEEVEVPDDPNHVLPRAESITMLSRVASNVSSYLQEAEVVAEQACFLPCSEDGLPLIGQIPGVKGLFVATGHSCWGILSAPATGASLAELIADGKSQLVDLKPFNPARFARVLHR
ncbi:hypothetical protein L7F22_035813 [Adiantum nelumboides]|nr:hypothetical protein [Adiantum nelumboides]